MVPLKQPLALQIFHWLNFQLHSARLTPKHMSLVSLTHTLPLLSLSPTHHPLTHSTDNPGSKRQTDSHQHSLTHSLSLSTPPPTHPLTHSTDNPGSKRPTDPHQHSLIHSLTHSLSLSLSHTNTHTHTPLTHSTDNIRTERQTDPHHRSRRCPHNRHRPQQQ